MLIINVISYGFPQSVSCVGIASALFRQIQLALSRTVQTRTTNTEHLKIIQVNLFIIYINY